MNAQCSNIYGIIHLLHTDLCFALLCTGLSIGCWVLSWKTVKLVLSLESLSSSSGKDVLSYWLEPGSLEQGPYFLSLWDCGWELGSCSWTARLFVAPKYWEEGVPCLSVNFRFSLITWVSLSAVCPAPLAYFLSLCEHRSHALGWDKAHPLFSIPGSPQLVLGVSSQMVSKGELIRFHRRPVGAGSSLR